MSQLSDVISAERSAVKNAQPVQHGGASAEGITLVGAGTDARPAVVRSVDPDDFVLPTGREEEWRFTPMQAVRGLLDGPASDAMLSVDADLPPGVTLDRVSADDPTLTDLPLPVDRLSALAGALAPSVLRLSVPKNATPTEPVVLRLTGTGADTVVWHRLVLDVAEQAEVTVVLEHSGSAQVGALLQVLVGDAAHLRLVQTSEWADDTVHAQHTAVRIGRDAVLRSTQVTLGGATVRSVETLDQTGPGSDAELAGVYLAGAGQDLQHRLTIDHSQPDCRSNVVYKGALQAATAHTVWVGDVIIRAAATGTDTYELNRNLVLADGARADSVPNLEIETGEIIGAGHASATGRFDDEQLFYLQARGIPADEARRMVVRGFFAEVVVRIPVPTVADRLMEAVDTRLGSVLVEASDAEATPAEAQK